MRDAHTDGGEAFHHRIDESLVLFEVGAAFVGDRVELLCAIRLRGDVAGLFEEGQRRIDHAGAWRIPARGFLLQHLDDLVAVARLLRDQGERDQANVALRQHAAGAAHVVAVAAAARTSKTPAAKAASAGMAAKAASAGAVFFVTFTVAFMAFAVAAVPAAFAFFSVSHSKHVISLAY